MRTISTILLMLSVVLSMGQAEPKTDNLIYHLLIKKYADSSAAELLIRDSTTTYLKYRQGGTGNRQRLFYDYFSSPDEASNFCTDFFAENKTRTLTQKVFPEVSKYPVFTTEEFKEIFTSSDGPGNWKNFQAHHPKTTTFYSISKIKYNPSKDLALVYIDNYCGDNCGAGYLVLFKKKDKSWEIVYDERLWKS